MQLTPPVPSAKTSLVVSTPAIPIALLKKYAAQSSAVLNAIKHPSVALAKTLCSYLSAVVSR